MRFIAPISGTVAGAVLGFVALLMATAGVTSARAAAPPSQPFCTALSQAVDTTAASGALFVASYQPGPKEQALPDPLKTSAFAYDNALAVIALAACGDERRAVRIADAFVIAIGGDRGFKDGRIRNAYRAGPVDETPVKLPGWWDVEANRWDEDAYQDGTSTGNAAWVALALLTAHQVTDDARYLDAASRLLGWIDAATADAPGPAGFAGGVTGFDGAQDKLTWKSTEHNIDIAGAASWAYRLTRQATDKAMAERAAAFVASRFRPDKGYFLLGTKPDGSDADPNQLALDVQLWPILAIANPPEAWRRALGFADAHLRRGDGMTFAGIGANRWTEGTGQAALAFRAVGANAVADRFRDGLAAHRSPSGLLFATSAGEVPTGLLVEAKGGGAFTYAHRPHLGATAWAVLAATGWNPFTGQKVN